MTELSTVDATPWGIEGLVCLVTGAGSGIGRGIAEVLLARGATVALNDIDPQSAAAVASDLGNADATCSFAGDVTDRDAAAALVDQVVDRFGRIDVLVNNAAGPAPVAPFLATDPRSWVASQSSLWGTLACSYAVLPGMVERRFGRIVNISSMGGSVGGANMALYCASKGGIDAFTRSLAKEIAPQGVTVNCVAPGLIDTPRQRSRPAGLRAERLKTVPVGRYGRPDEVGHAVAFMADRSSSYITGEVLFVDGGRP